MAFITKNSKAFIQLKFDRLYGRNSILRHAGHSKILACVTCCQSERHHHYYSTNSLKTVLLSPIGKHNLKLSSFNISSQRYISSDSEKLQVFVTEPSTSNSGIASPVTEGSANKVLFVETPQVSETPPPVESIVSSAAETSGFVSDGVANLTLTSDLPSVAAAVAEPTLSSLGLCNYTPVGFVQVCLEYLHVNMHMPWWLTIMTATVIVRALMFPIFVKAQKNASAIANYMPEMQFLQAKFTEARKTGNAYEASKVSQELMDFMKKNNVNPLKNMLIPLSQAPVFISYFFALRAMSNVPVASMETGGLWWFPDLTIPDPYYGLPLVACSTLFAILKVGAEGGARMDDLKLTKYVLMAMPFIAFPFCINFPSAVLVYWCTNNFLSLGLVFFMKIEAVRKYFGIQKIKPPPKIFSADKKGFIEGIKEAVDNQKILNSMEDRRRVDRVQFQKAGTGPIPRTYRYDPTKARPANAAAAAAREDRTKS